MIGFDKSKFRVEREEGAESGDPFGDVVQGRYGHLYIHGADLFGVATNGRGMARKVAALARVVQSGDDGGNAVFGPDRLASVARLIGAQRRSQLSPERQTHPAAESTNHTLAA